MNSLFVIRPYRYLGMWVFDDEARGLKQEPFVGGADSLIDLATKGMPNAKNGFGMIFAAHEFPGATLHLNWVKAELSGNTYHCEEFDQEGWLCPALLRYFDTPPSKLFVKIFE